MTAKVKDVNDSSFEATCFVQPWPDRSWGEGQSADTWIHDGVRWWSTEYSITIKHSIKCIYNIHNSANLLKLNIRRIPGFRKAILVILKSRDLELSSLPCGIVVDDWACTVQDTASLFAYPTRPLTYWLEFWITDLPEPKSSITLLQNKGFLTNLYNNSLGLIINISN